MPYLWDQRHERVAQELFLGKRPGDASRLAGFNDKAKAFASNARKRACRPDIRARVAELQQRAAVLAEVDRGYLLAGLKQAADFNIADYLEFEEHGNAVKLVLKGRSRELLGRVGEIGVDRDMRVNKVKGERIAALTEIARIIGVHKDPVADALEGIGERLKQAFERAAGAK